MLLLIMRCLALAPSLLVLVASRPAAAQAGLPEPVREVFEATCFDCHRTGKAEGGLDLEAFTGLPELERIAIAIQARNRVVAGEMPPIDVGQLDRDELEVIQGWVEDQLEESLPGLELVPGRTTIRRLSRGDYERSVLDLFGVSAAAAVAAFPSDALGYGFDTIGDAVSSSTLHAEAYLDAAIDVAARIVDVAELGVVRAKLGRELLADTHAGRRIRDGFKLSSAGSLSASFALPRPGRYRLTVTAWGDQAGDQPARMKVSAEREGVAAVDMWNVPSVTFDVPEREPEPFSFEFESEHGGQVTVRASFINDFYRPAHPDPTRRDRNLAVDRIVLEGPLTPFEVAGAQWLLDAGSGRRTMRQRLSNVAKTLLRRTWRRPPTTAERRRFVALALDAAKAVDEKAAGVDRIRTAIGIRTMVEAALASPHFVYRVESSRSRGRPSDDELAVRLSFTLWGSVPDARLNELADAGSLHDATTFRAEVLRMLRDPRGSVLATVFAAQWLELRSLEDHFPDPARYPFDEELRTSMRRETELVFESVLREGRPVRELFDADFTFLDQRLARHYGVAGEFDHTFRRVPAPRPGGIVGHASILTLTSNPTRTSPVKRGKWLLDNLLDSPPPPPAPGTDNFPDESAIAVPADLRAQLALHRRDPKCAVCHVRMDGLGLALERFDAVGRSRGTDADADPIDVRGELPGGREIEGLDGIRDELRSSAAPIRALTKKFFIYAVGRDVDSPADILRIERILRSWRDLDAVTVQDVIAAVLASDAFCGSAMRKSR